MTELALNWGFDAYYLISGLAKGGGLISEEGYLSYCGCCYWNWGYSEMALMGLGLVAGKLTTYITCYGYGYWTIGWICGLVFSNSSL